MNKALVELARAYANKALWMRQLGHSDAYYEAAAKAVLELAKL